MQIASAFCEFVKWPTSQSANVRIFSRQPLALMAKIEYLVILMRKNLYRVSVILAFLVPNWVQGQSAAVTTAASPSSLSSTNATTASPPVAIALPNVVAEADSTTARISSPQRSRRI